MKYKKVEVAAEKTDTGRIVGNCSKCNGPVVSKWYVGEVKVGEYQECLNCGAKHFPSFGKTVHMDDDKKVGEISWEKNLEKLKDDLIKDNEYWPNDTYHPWPYYTDPYVSPYNTPKYPGYTWPLITCGTCSYSTKDNPNYRIYATN